MDVVEQKDNEELPEGSAEESTATESEIVEEDEVEIINDDDDEDEEEVDELTQARNDVEEYKKRFLRAHADMENFRRRAERDKQDAIKFANKNIFLQMLDVLDNFDRALSAVADPKDNFVIGVKMIQKQLTDVLTQNGVEEINSMGRQFDPYLDEALAKEPTEEHEENTVIEVFQRGFRYHGTLLRPSKVKVAVPPEKEQPEAETETQVEDAPETSEIEATKENEA